MPTIEDIARGGKKNVFEPLVAIIPSKLDDMRKEINKQRFAPYTELSHRLEYVVTIDGITYINDSMSTNPNSTFFALRSFEEISSVKTEAKGIVLIAGGPESNYNYGLNYEGVWKENLKDVDYLINLSEKGNPLFQEIFDLDKQFHIKNMGCAVALAHQLAKKDWIVLLSPGYPSFDLFENKIDRGNKFQKYAKDLPYDPPLKFCYEGLPTLIKQKELKTA